MSSDDIEGRPTPTPDGPELTLADLVRTVERHSRLGAIVFIVILMGAVAYTGFQPTVYEARATLIPTAEKAALIDVLRSRDYASRIAPSLGLSADEVRLSTEIEIPVGELKGSATLVTVVSRWQDPETAAQIANAYVSGIEEHRGILENITEDLNWQEYYERANENETQARADLQALIDGQTYAQPLSTAQPPASATSPNVILNIGGGFVGGIVMGIMSTFVAEGIAGIRDELRRKRANLDP